MKKILLSAVLLVAVVLTAGAQRKTDKLDRGLIAIPNGSGNFVSWKIFGEEYYDTEFNLYRNGVKVNAKPLKVSNYQDNSGSASSRYQVAPVVRGVEQELSAEVVRWNNQYFDIPVANVVDRNGNDVTGEYILNDISLGDVDGDGIVEFIVKRNYTGDIRNASNTTKFHHYECYNLQGKRLWWIDLGPNMMAGPDEQWDVVSFDWDQDGKAECIMRGADNMIFHTADGTALHIGNMNYVAPRDEYTNQGAEYLIYFNGETGAPFAWNGNGTSFTPMAYPLPRFEAGEAVNPLDATANEYIAAWGASTNGGKDTGHKSSKHYFGAPYFDGRNPSIFLGRGCYTRHKMCALDVNPATHELTQRWRWDNNGGWSDPWFGNGFHNFQIADVDWDGRDEIVFGSMVIDDNGKGLCTTGLGHGDAQHCSDLDPYRHGQEQFTCNEDEPACTYYNATTGKIYYRLQSTGDDGRALCANFSNNFPGCLGRTTQTGLVSTVADKVIQGGPSTSGNNDALFWSHLNQRIYWDGDLLDEVMDSPGSDAREGAIYKPDGGRLLTTSGCNTNNSSKNNPGAIADIFGDWREELVMRAESNTRIRIWTTPLPTKYGLYTLWHDHQYRNAMVWQSVGYNQPPHKSYFVGELEGITVAPPPFTTVGRTLIANGGSISSANADQHVMVCETNNTNIQVADGANPYIATFNVPSHVQGTNSKLLNGKAVINYEYFTCNVTGGAFTGDMRLVKQGDGILNLPKVDNTYTGSTDIWGGTVNFDGTARQSKVWMNRFAELNSDGGEFKQVEMSYDAKLRPGRGDNKGQIVISDSLKLGFGSRVIFDIYGADLSADLVKGKVLSIETKNWNYGPQYLTPVFEFTSHGTETESIVQGKYLIGEFEEIDGDLTKIIITGLGNSFRAALSYEEGKLYLNISGVRDAGSVIWDGSESAVWAMGGETNFTSADDQTNTDEIFVSGDKVLFDDSAQKFNVELTGEIMADSIIVDNTRAYTFSGNGTIVGSSKLVKRGSGTLTVKTDNSYTGGTRISGGTLSISALSNANQARGNTGAVSSSYSKFIIENGATLTTTAAVTQGSPMQMLTEEGGIINNSNDFITNSGITGTKLTKRGSGWMKFNTNNNGLGRLVIMGGTVQCINCTQPASTVEYQGGTLSENGGTNYAVHVPEGKTGTWNTANRSSYSNKLTGAGTLTIYCEEEKGTGWFATRTQLSMDFSEFEGTIKATGRSDDSGARWTLNTSNGMPNGTLDIAEGLEVQNTGKVFAIGALAGKGKLGGYASFSNNGGSGTNTWKVGSDKNFTWEGLVTSNSVFNKVGTGMMTVKGKWTNTGNSNVTEGTLCISSGTLGTGSVNVGTNGTLIGTNTSAIGITNSSITVNGRIQAGATLNAYTGTLYFSNKNLVIGSSGTLAVGMRGRVSTLLSDINVLTLNGKVQVYFHSAYTPAAGDSICLWKANRVVGTPTFDLPELAEGLVWDTSKYTTGYLYIRSNETDGISLTQGERMPTKGNIYNVRGQLVRKNSNNLNGLPRGIYFQNGKKFIVK